MKTIQHKFVEFIPNNPKQDILYISIEYRTAVHLCACGCGNKVVTPLSPTDWELRFDGKTVSLFPSIGNWNFECKSHYFITRSKICYARIEEGSKVDAHKKKSLFKKSKRNKVYFLKSVMSLITK